jgi:cytochrome P450/NADPH-cytochrome P450 reductase
MRTGSNAGTCKALAQKLSDTASRRGFAVTVGRLNDITSGSLPTDRPLAIVTASYEGQVRARRALPDLC